MGELGDLVTQYGIGIVCLIYFMFRDYKFTDKLTVTLAALQAVLSSLNKRLDFDQKEGDEDGILR